MQLTPSGCRFIVRGIPQRHMVGGISVIWEIPNRDAELAITAIRKDTRMEESHYGDIKLGSP